MEQPCDERHCGEGRSMSRVQKDTQYNADSWYEIIDFLLIVLRTRLWHLHKVQLGAPCYLSRAAFAQLVPKMLRVAKQSTTGNLLEDAIAYYDRTLARSKQRN